MGAESFERGHPHEEFSPFEIEEFADAIFSIFTKRRLMAMMAVYLDESGTHGSSPIITVGGYLAPVVQWKHFQSKWKAALQKEGIGYFHMTDFENRRGQFEGWTEERKVPFFQKLSKILLSHVTLGVAMAVVIDDYNTAIPLEHREGVHPYTFCAMECMRQIRWWTDQQGIRDPIAYVLEDGGPNPGEILRGKRQLESDSKLREAYRYSSLTHCDKRAMIQLQAADILAYETWKQSQRIYKGERDKELRKSIQQLLPPQKRYFTRYYDKTVLTYWLETVIGRGENRLSDEDENEASQ